MKVLIVSSSLEVQSRSEFLARRCAERLEGRCDIRSISLKDYPLTGRELSDPLASDTYRTLHGMVRECDGLVLASPVYNWSYCAELKRFIEVIGTHPRDGVICSAFFDKVVAFVNSAGAVHSYTAFTGLASSLMLDFKCVISPYNVYAHARDWENGVLSERVEARITKSMDVFLQLVTLLAGRTYSSDWEL